MKVSATLKGKKDAYGRRSVYIRISDGKSRKFTATDIKVKPSDFLKGKIKTSEPRHFEFNKRILKLIVDAEQPRDKYPDATFKEYGYDCLNEWDRLRADATISHYKTEIEFFIQFAGNIPLSKITVQVLNKYKAHLFGRGLDNNTVWKKFKALKKIINKAVKERVIEKSPFLQFENIKYKNPQKQFLTREQVDQIDDYCKRPDTPERISFIGTWFVIGCYTGLRFSDMQKFGKHLITNKRLILYTTKTGEIISLPINDKLTELFNRVGYGPLDITNQKYNEYLKVLAGAVELPPLNAHMSRHSFAVRCADAGISPEVTAKLMGVTNLKTVAIYYRLTGNRTDEEYAKIFH